MANYRCSTCGNNNPDAYVTCNHPLCPDGHDQGPAWQAMQAKPVALPNATWGHYVLWCVLGASAWAIAGAVGYIIWKVLYGPL